MRVHELKNSLAKSYITKLRDKSTSLAEFRQAGRSLINILFSTACQNLDSFEYTVYTPLDKYVGSKTTSPVFIPILRAGLSFLDIGFSFFPEAVVGMIGLSRDEQTAKASMYYKKLPNLTSKDVFILEPMLATGGTITQVIAEVQKQNPKTISILSIISSTQGIENLKYVTNVDLFTCEIDSDLTQKKYITPGLGDFGDRWFGV